jgi:hypothetical protein
MNNSLDISPLPKPRFEPSERDLLGLAIAKIAAGEWWPPLTEVQGRDLLINYIESVGPKPERSVAVLYGYAQNRVMAYRHKNFEDIQADPLYSERSEENCRALTCAYAQGGKSAAEAEWSRIFASQERTPRAAIPYITGDGKSAETAIQFSASSRLQLLRAQYWLLYFHLGWGWTDHCQMRTEPDSRGRIFDVHDITTIAGEPITLYVRYHTPPGRM